MAYTITPRNTRWNANSHRLRTHIESVVIPAARWGAHRADDRPAEVRRALATGDYLRD